jgi:hypothetical protein
MASAWMLEHVMGGQLYDQCRDAKYVMGGHLYDQCRDAKHVMAGHLHDQCWDARTCDGGKYLNLMLRFQNI